MAESRISEIEEDIATVKVNNSNWHGDAVCLAYLTELQKEKNLLRQQQVPPPAPVSGKLSLPIDFL